MLNCSISSGPGMVAPLTVRISLLLTAIGLAACGALPRSVTVRPGEPSTISLTYKNGIRFTLRNDSGANPNQVYSGAKDQMSKVVPDSELQALLDVFTAEQLFEQSLPSVPGRSRDVLQLEQGNKSWFWVRRGSFTDPREAAFNKASQYFLSLYNGSTAYHTGPSSEDGYYPSFLSDKELARRNAELRALEKRKKSSRKKQ